MRPAQQNEISIAPIRPPSDTHAPASELVAHGRRTGRIVKGVVLEAAVRFKESFLIFLTDEIPNEDTLRIYLIDSSLQVSDSASIGAIYSTGTFSDLELIEPNKVRFRFIGGTDWTLELLERPQLSLPFLSKVAGVRRPFTLCRRFIVHGNPQPER